MAVKKGEKVLAYPGGEERIGFVLDPGANDDGKHAIQIGSDVIGLAYRETGEDEAKGGTFRKLGG